MLRHAIAIVLAMGMGIQMADAAHRVMLEARADAGISSVDGRLLESNGAGPSAAIRQTQNWSGFETKALLLNFDVEPIRGWQIDEAYLHLYVAKGDLYGVGLCEVLAPWQEGSAENGEVRRGSPSWQFARVPKDPDKPEPADWWAWPGSGIYSVSWSHPQARYSHAGPGQFTKAAGLAPGIRGVDASRNRWIHLRIPVRADMVASLAAGTSYGWVLTDDKGQVAESYSLLGSGYPYRYNEAEDIYVFTRQIHDPALRPQLEVIGRPAPEREVPALQDLKVVDVQPSTGQVTLELTVPGGRRDGQLLAYDILYMPADREGDSGEPTALPRWAITRPGQPGSKQQIPIWTLDPGQYVIGVRAVDMAGRRGPVAEVAVTVPPRPDAKLAQVRDRSVSAGDRASVDAQGEEPAQPQVYVVPDMVKVDPVSGAVLQSGDTYRMLPAYASLNPVWSAADRRIRLESAANEVVAFQVIVRKDQQPLGNVRVRVSDLRGPAGQIAADPNAQVFRVWYIESRRQARRPVGPNEEEITDTRVRPVAWHAEAAVPMTAELGETVDVPAAANNIPEQSNQSIWVDLYVPKDTRAGDYTGKVTVEGDGLSPVEMELALTVLPLTLPDDSSWIVELNSYGGLAGYAGVGGSGQGAREAEWKFYRLSKAHRQMIDALPYKQSGRVENTAPVLEGDGGDVRVVDWTPFDRHFGPLLDGSAFTAEQGYVGPGAGTPISQMYVHFHENWPLTVKEWYGDYADLQTRLDFAEWAKTSRDLSQAYPLEYQRGYRSVARQFAEHCQQQGWTRTIYHVFMNNKYYFKVPYFASEVTTGGNGTSFWLLDEPVDYDDYMANRFFLGLAQEGLRQANAPDVEFALRTDVSQPHMARGLWDGVCNLWVSSRGAIRSGYVTTAVVRQKWLPGEQFWHYGGGPGLSASPLATLQSFLTSWATGASGILPYWTTNGGNNWVRPSEPDLALFYTGRNYANSGRDYPGPFASLRLKFMRRAQQDIEYLHLLAGKEGWDRARVREALKAYADDADAPVLLFDRLTPEQGTDLRRSLAATLQSQER